MSVLSSLENRIKRFGRKILYKQERIGQYGVPFVIYKLRTMKEGSNLPKHTMDKPCKNDEMLWYGRILRRTGIDESPQLYNIAKGQMTFVGPRPLIKSDHNKFPTQTREKRERVKPAMAGAGYASSRPLTPAVEYEMDSAFVDMAEINYARAQIYFGLKIFYNLITLRQKLK